MVWLFQMTMVGALAACGSEASTVTAPPPESAPTPGWLTVQLITPNSNDGAVQFTVSGPGLDSVAVDEYASLSTVNGGVADVVVTGSVVGGTMARIHVPDVSQAGAYAASVTAAAAQRTYQLQDLAGYRAVIVH